MGHLDRSSLARFSGRIALLLLSMMALAGVVAAPVAFATSAKSPSVVRELADKRTETSEQSLMSDGSMRATLHSAPVRFKDPSGAWQDIDGTLVPATTPGDVVAASLPVTERFGDTDGAAPTAQLSTREWSLGMDLPSS